MARPRFILNRVSPLKRIALLAVIMLLIAVYPFSVPSRAEVNATVTLTFDSPVNHHYIDQNSTLTGTLYGNITCDVDAQDVEYRYVKVRITPAYTEWWGPTNTNEYLFTTSGVQRFALPYRIPEGISNVTVNEITVKGTWDVEKYGSSKTEEHGEAIPDVCDLVVHPAEAFVNPYPESNSTGPIAQDGFFDDIGLPCVLGMLAIPVLVVFIIIFAIIIIAYRKAKKKRKE